MNPDLPAIVGQSIAARNTNHWSSVGFPDTAIWEVCHVALAVGDESVNGHVGMYSQPALRTRKAS